MTVVIPTDYSSITPRLESLIDRPPMVSVEGLERMLDVMREDFPALTQQRNPVNANLDMWTKQQLAYIIQEYSGFSNASIHMFLDARIRNHWPTLTDEIIRNMDEEMGALTRGIPHLELMRHGYRAELGIETDDIELSALTKEFIARMNALFRKSNNAFLAGVLLAFEATAVDEFRIIERILRRYKRMNGGEIDRQSLTGEYIAGHVVPGAVDTHEDPEMDHCRGMMEAVSAHLNDAERPALVSGFLAVCLELNRWWEQIGFEAIHKGIRDRLVDMSCPTPDLYPSLSRAA